jgi:maltose O-acetyltransferase
MKFTIGKGSVVLMHCWFDAVGGLTIDTNVVMDRLCRLDTRGGINIGKNVSISNDTIILTASHDIARY